MTWTVQTPTAPGYYWISRAPEQGSTGEIVNVTYNDIGQLVVQHFGRPETRCPQSLRTKWLGPIDMQNYV